LQIADQLAREGNPENAPALVNAALRRVKAASSVAATTAEQANANLLAGFIAERYLGDSASALSSYEAAAKLDPNSKRATEFADRAKRQVEAANAKQGSK
jgi:hypothetical protein